MLGQMMNKPLLISSLIEHAQRFHGETEIVSVKTTGGLEQTSWGQVARNARALASALTNLGLPTSTEPVKVILRTSGRAIRVSEMKAALPQTRFRQPSGNPASSR